MTNILLLPDGCVAGIKSRALYCGKMHALKGRLRRCLAIKRRHQQIFESTSANAIELQDVEKEGIKTKPDRGLNQNRRMSHMGSTSIPNDHPMGQASG